MKDVYDGYYGRLILRLRDGTKLPVLQSLMSEAADAIDDLLLVQQLNAAEIIRLRRQIEVLKMADEGKIADTKEGNRVAYRRWK